VSSLDSRRVRHAIVRFGPFRANLETGELQKDETRIRLQQFPFAILRALIERSCENPEAVATRDELRTLLWGQSAGDFDVALNTAIRKIRAALVDPADNPRYVETLPKRGYRFVGRGFTGCSRAPAGIFDGAPRMEQVGVGGAAGDSRDRGRRSV